MKLLHNVTLKNGDSIWDAYYMRMFETNQFLLKIIMFVYQTY